MANFTDLAIEKRQPSTPIHPLILGRWSPRAMSGEGFTDQELRPLIEAARWAPSSFNEQPWKILYGRKGTPHWDLFYKLLIEFNQQWCKNAGVLFAFISCNTFEKNGKYSPTHSYDTGAAWMALALEGTSRGYVVHGMSGFDYEKARTDLEIPEGYTVEAMAAAGKKAPTSILPEAMQQNEAPSTRKPLESIAKEGKFT